MLLGKNLIDGQWLGSRDTVASPDLDGFEFAQASTDHVEKACVAAKKSFRAYSWTPREKRADFLERIAVEIDILGTEITEVGMKETGLPEGRLNGERGRTTGQLKMFAALIRSDEYLDVRIEKALPERQPAPRPDIRLTHRAIGPVAVFGASNFPLAFSTAGGDTASALAAGCPVIVKGHGAHAGTAELVAQAIQTAIRACDMPAATFQLLQGAGRVVGSSLVNHPDIKAVGFTGSTAGGRALYNQCHSRPTPIPFYGELGSINPVFCLPAAMMNRPSEIGQGWANSLMMGAGQFCTNPGILVGVRGSDFKKLQKSAIEILNDAASQKMLTDDIKAAYENGVQGFDKLMQKVTSCEEAVETRHAMPAAFKIDAQTWMQTPELQHEVFGASGIFVECDSTDQMSELAEGLEGQLTATMHLEPEDHYYGATLAVILEEKVGRILCNGYPTGVEVNSAMMHGGPYPASTDVRATSVGTLAIVRWIRPVAFQNFPRELLHPEIQ